MNTKTEAMNRKSLQNTPLTHKSLSKELMKSSSIENKKVRSDQAIHEKKEESFAIEDKGKKQPVIMIYEKSLSDDNNSVSSRANSKTTTNKPSASQDLNDKNKKKLFKTPTKIVTSRIPKVTSATVNKPVSKPLGAFGLKRDLESPNTNTKLTKFNSLKKEVEDKQKHMLEMYVTLKNCVRSQKEKEQLMNGMKLIKYAEKQSTRAASPDNCIIILAEEMERASIVDFGPFCTGLKATLQSVPGEWMAFALQLSEIRANIVEWIKKKGYTYDRASTEEAEIAKKLQMAEEVTNERVEKICLDVENMYETLERFKAQFQVLNDSKSVTQLVQENKSSKSQYSDIENKLEKETAKGKQLELKVEALQSQNKSHKIKIKELEQELVVLNHKLAEDKILLEKKIKELKNKKDEKKVSKKELSELLENKYVEVCESKKQLEQVNGKLEAELIEYKEKLVQESKEKSELKEEVMIKTKMIVDLQEKANELTLAAERSKLNVPELENPTKREQELWTELEALRVIVKSYESKLEKLKQDKVKLLVNYEQVAGDEGSTEIEKYAAMLALNEENINTYKQKVVELQHKCENIEKEKTELKEKLAEIDKRVLGEDTEQSLVMLKELRIMRSRIQEQEEKLTLYEKHNEELEAALMQKGLELEHRDKVLKHQMSVVKARDDLVNLLEGKTELPYVTPLLPTEDAEAMCMSMVDAKFSLVESESILEEKFREVEKLQRLIRQMEDQQDRAQAQRVRFEARIAELQKQLYNVKKRNQI